MILGLHCLSVLGAAPCCRRRRSCPCGYRWWSSLRRFHFLLPNPRAAFSLFDIGMAFEVSYAGSPVAERCITRALAARGLRRGTASDRDCVVQWAPYSQIAWCRALQPVAGVPPLLVAAFPVRTALVRKDGLAVVLKQLASSVASASSCDVLLKEACAPSFSVDLSGDIASQVAGALGDGSRTDAWVIKLVASNNATGVTFVEDREGLLRALCVVSRQHAEAGNAPPSRPLSPLVSIQRYVASPLLATGGRKAHVRVNVLCVCNGGGSGTPALRILVHREPVVHVACEPWRAADWHDPFVHVTNHCVQRAHPAFSSATHTLSLSAYLREAAGVAALPAKLCPGLAFSRMCAVVARVFQLVATHDSDRASEAVECLPHASAPGPGAGTATPSPPAALPFPAHRHGFLTMGDAFEVFGFDFIFSAAPAVQDPATAGCGPRLVTAPFPVLLEINGGPALEGLADPTLCRRVVEDVVAEAVDPWLRAHAADVAAAKRLRRVTSQPDACTTSDADGSSSDDEKCYVDVPASCRRGCLCASSEHRGDRDVRGDGSTSVGRPASINCSSCGDLACGEERVLLCFDGLPTPELKANGGDGATAHGCSCASSASVSRHNDGFCEVWSSGIPKHR